MDLERAAAEVAQGRSVRLAGQGYALRFQVPEHRVAKLSPVPDGGLKAKQRVLVYCPYNEAYIMAIVRKVSRGRVLVAYPWDAEAWLSEPTRVVGRLTFEDVAGG